MGLFLYLSMSRYCEKISLDKAHLNKINEHQEGIYQIYFPFF